MSKNFLSIVLDVGSLFSIHCIGIGRTAHIIFFAFTPVSSTDLLKIAVPCAYANCSSWHSLPSSTDGKSLNNEQ